MSEERTVAMVQDALVRVLEPTGDASGSRPELEGDRLPLTRSRDVSELRRGS